MKQFELESVWPPPEHFSNRPASQDKSSSTGSLRQSAIAENLTPRRPRIDAMKGELAAGLSDPLSWKEICERFPDEWVALVEIEWTNDCDFEFRSARVAGHGKRRRDPMQQAAGLWSRYPEIGHFYTGRVRAPMTPLLFSSRGSIRRTA